MPQKPENIFPKFAAGDPASKFLNHKLLNNLTDSVASLSQKTIGQPRINTQGGEFQPPVLPDSVVRLVKVLDIGTTGSGGFKAAGNVNVVKVELVDAIYAESPGLQDLKELNASSRILYAAAPTSVSLSVDDYTWVTIWSGQWWVVNTGGSASGGAAIKFEVISYSSALGQGAIGCDYVDAQVTQVSCNHDSVSVGDGVRIWDPDFCYLNLPISLLDGLRGTAQLMKNSIEVYDVNDLTDCEYEVLVAGDCRWIVTGVCCAEEYPL